MPNALSLLLGRALLAAVFIPAGLQKLMGGIDGTAGMIAGAGLPAATALAWAAAIFEIVAGLAVLVGFQTRIASVLLAAFCLFTAFMFHNGPITMPDFPDAANGMLTLFNQIMMFKNIGLAGGFLVLAGAGAGAWSLDARGAKA
ncbi:MAG: DoxX family protein [Rhizobiaceae bacterium]|jgi:putative oxidoreductase|nr:DoxX family protein [Rhizobiaceae bacterium]